MCGADYVKVGLHGSKTYDDALAMMRSVVESVRLVSPDILVVASGYADYRRFGGVSCKDVVYAARDSHADVVMLDTAIKDGRSLFDNMSGGEVREFVELGHAAGLRVALAGSITEKDIGALTLIGPDIVGVRGAVCDANNRNAGVTLERVRAFMDFVRESASGKGSAAMQPAAVLS